jgi:hypothetical protein
MPSKIGGPFVPLPREVISILATEKDASMKKYILMLSECFIQEVVDEEGEWVHGLIAMSKNRLAQKIGAGRGHFFSTMFPRWQELGLVGATGEFDNGKKNEDGIRLLMYYRKGDHFQMPLPVRKEINLLRKQLYQMEELVRSLTEIPGTGNPEGNVVISDNEEETPLDLCSSDLIDQFYNGIGQDRISPTKRRQAGAIIAELRHEFSLEEISRAITWTLEGAKGKDQDVHSFAIIEHTIGQALAAIESEKERTILEAEHDKEEREHADKVEEEQKAREAIDRKLEALSDEERLKVEQEARAELSHVDGLTIYLMEENPFLIDVKIREILRRELDAEPETDGEET